MKLYSYTILFFIACALSFGLEAQPVYKPYNPYWQWGRADTARSFTTPGSSVLP